MRLSVRVPLLNGEESAGTLLERVMATPLPGLEREIVVADDGSSGASVREMKAVAARYPVVIRSLNTHRKQGKAAALARAIADAQGEIAIIQNAHLEYDPRECQPHLAPLLDLTPWDPADLAPGNWSSGSTRCLSERAALQW